MVVSKKTPDHMSGTHYIEETFFSSSSPCVCVRVGAGSGKASYVSLAAEVLNGNDDGGGGGNSHVRCPQ